MQSERLKDKLMRLDFDIHHISVMSRKNISHHALVRLIISTLATVEELENLIKKDVRKKSSNGLHSVVLRRGGKSRIAYIDELTYKVLMNLCEKKKNREKIFSFTQEEMDSIVKIYSPPGKEYGVNTLRNAVIKILKDCSFFDDYIPYITGELKAKNKEDIEKFLLDFHPMFSGMWDLEDEEVATDFLEIYSEVTGEELDKISEKLEKLKQNIKI